jgi:hypothetical protein
VLDPVVADLGEPPVASRVDQLHGVLLVIALVWVFVGVGYISITGRDSSTDVRKEQRRWWFWRWINLVQVALVCFVIYFRDGLAGWSWAGPCWLSSVPPLNGMWLLAVCYAVLLLGDLWKLFEVLDTDPATEDWLLKFAPNERKNVRFVIALPKPGLQKGEPHGLERRLAIYDGDEIDGILIYIPEP